MIISFNTIEDENNGFEVLAITNQKFTYLGDYKVEINKNQYDVLVLNKVKFMVVKL